MLTIDHDYIVHISLILARLGCIYFICPMFVSIFSYRFLSFIWTGYSFETFHLMIFDPIGCCFGGLLRVNAFMWIRSCIIASVWHHARLSLNQIYQMGYHSISYHPRLLSSKGPVIFKSFILATFGSLVCIWHSGNSYMMTFMTIWVYHEWEPHNCLLLPLICVTRNWKIVGQWRHSGTICSSFCFLWEQIG